MNNDYPKVVPISKRITENPTTVTLHLAWQREFIPGQFVMIWIPGVGEKPFSIAGKDAFGIIITVRVKGRFSERLAKLEVNNVLGLRGPYGKGFDLEEKCCLVAGGVGIAALAPLIDLYPDCRVLYGENTAENRIYRHRFSNIDFFTMDGSEGKRGIPSDALEDVLKGRKYRAVCSCGPEPLLAATVSTCEAAQVKCQVSLERYMKCAMGLCGACSCGQFRVCSDGPVFDAVKLAGNSDFGYRMLDASGTWRIV